MHGIYQHRLFESGAQLPNGFVYRPDFITLEEEHELLGYFDDLPFEHPVQEGYAAKRSIINFGWGYDFDNGTLIPGPPLPQFLLPLARRVAKWIDLPVGKVAEALITRYPAGSAIGWHRDNESFEHIVGISLSGACRMRLRPIRSRLRGRTRTLQDLVAVELSPRSAYLMQGESRFQCQHSIPPVPELRYSITFRTLPRS